MEISEPRQVIFLTGEQEWIVKGVYPGSVGLMQSIPPSVGEPKDRLSKAL